MLNETKHYKNVAYTLLRAAVAIVTVRSVKCIKLYKDDSTKRVHNSAKADHTMGFPVKFHAALSTRPKLVFSV